jgi:hypothetical protein
MELSLVDINTHPDDAVLDRLTHQTVLNQYPTDLRVTPIDIVGPFDTHVTNLLPQGVSYCQ